MDTIISRQRKGPRPPSGFEGHLSRKQAAALLGLASEFKIRQLEKEGRLQPVRGAMGSAWYARAEITALRPELDAPAFSPGPGQWTDGALIALLRKPVANEGTPRMRTVVDLVAETGISIPRAEKVYRFWLSHDAHPAARAARAARATQTAAVPSSTPTAVTFQPPSERRGDQRIERDTLIRQLRDPDPRVRDDAFEKLRTPQRK